MSGRWTVTRCSLYIIIAYCDTAVCRICKCINDVCRLTAAYLVLELYVSFTHVSRHVSLCITVSEPPCADRGIHATRPHRTCHSFVVRGSCGWAASRESCLDERGGVARLLVGSVGMVSTRSMIKIGGHERPPFCPATSQPDQPYFFGKLIS